MMKYSLTNELNAPPSPIAAPKLQESSQYKLFAHSDFVEWLEDQPDEDPVAKRAQFCLRSLLAYGYAPKTKGVVGAGKGWQRALLGGNGGSHFYLWYTSWAYEPGQELGLSQGEIAVRVVRHHDETKYALSPGEISDYYPFSTSDAEISHLGSSPYTERQRQIAVDNSAPVTVLRGYPGSGKTTSLWLSALHSGSHKLLYLTYSAKLANEAQTYFATFRPEGAEIDVMTFGGLLDYLEDVDQTSPVDNTESARSLLAELAKKPNLLKFLSDQPDELYAELHAHALGRALPIDFKGVPATETLVVRDYPTMRKSDVGSSMATVVSEVLQVIAESSLEHRFFPTLTRARRLLNDVNEPPPPRLEGCTAILVDEVQDLTQIEAFLLLNVCARIGQDSGQMPHLYLAGDESQTVRPTAFEWAWLKDLVTTVFGPTVEINDVGLEENLRSPERIALFVEATRSQYSRFDKNDRPSGLTYTSTNDTVPGRVIYCTVDDAEIPVLLEGLSKIPRSCVVYPGFVSPPELVAMNEGAELVYSSEEVKGLDFDVVALMDAGKRQADLEHLIVRRTSEPYVNVMGRTLADQYRVAASRASETLLLIDRRPDEHAEAMSVLCATATRKSLKNGSEVTATVGLEFEDDISTLLAQLQTDVDKETLVRSTLDEIRSIVDSQPERAILKSASALRIMERLRQEGDFETQLEDEVLRVRAVAILVGLLQETKFKRIEKSAIEAESRHIAQRINLGDAYDNVRELASNTFGTSDRRTIQRISAAISSLEDVKRDLPEVYLQHEGRILRWHDRLRDQDCPADWTKTLEILPVARNLVKKLSSNHSYLKDQMDAICNTWARQLIDRRNYKEALIVISEVTSRDFETEGRCYRGLGNLRAAAAVYEEGGLLEAALLCLREIPDIDASIEMAGRMGHPSLQVLTWLKSSREALFNRPDNVPDIITGQEVDQLIKWAKMTATDPALIPEMAYWTTPDHPESDFSVEMNSHDEPF
jgi:hypothetical protein